MTDAIHDLIELAARLEHCRLEQRDHVLIRREPRARDGPIRHPEPLRSETRRSGAHSASQHGSRPIDYRSKGIG
jgi:hypothetical protein